MHHRRQTHTWMPPRATQHRALSGERLAASSGCILYAEVQQVRVYGASRHRDEASDRFFGVEVLSYVV